MLLRKFVCGVAGIMLQLPLLAQADPIPSDKLPFVGNWGGPGLNLSIDKDGGVRYSRATTGKPVNFTGDFVAFRGNNLEVRVGEKLVVIEFAKGPTPNDGAWSATVDGVNVSRAK